MSQNVSSIRKLGGVFKSSLFGKEYQEILHKKTRTETEKMIKMKFRYLRITGRYDFFGIHGTINGIVEDILSNHDILVQLTNLRVHDEYTYGHSINVCVLSIVMGIKMQLNTLQLFELALGALLHDIGKLAIPYDTLNKKENLSPVEWNVIRSHTDQGFKMLYEKDNIPLPSSHVVFQHHENHDGSGYPCGIGGDEIHPYAKVVAVVDFYDAITSDRAYKPAFFPQKAYEMVKELSGTKFDPVIADCFLENMAYIP